MFLVASIAMIRWIEISMIFKLVCLHVYQNFPSEMRNGVIVNIENYHKYHYYGHILCTS